MRERAAHARLARGVRPSRRRRSSVARGWWQLARWPGIAVEQPVRRPERQLAGHVDPEIRCGRGAETGAAPCGAAAL
jgi:hypothetical protein